MKRENIEATKRECELILRELAEQLLFTQNVAESQAIILNILRIHRRIIEIIEATQNNQTEK